LKIKNEFPKKWKIRNNKISKSKKLYKYTDEHRKNLSKKMKILAQQGIIGWKPRKEPSYAEKFFMKVLDDNNLKYLREYKIVRFFADFAFLDKKIVLEIDGKQHLYRKEYDKKRDKILRKNGWKVFRIAWKNINIKNNASYIGKEIKKFLKFYQNENNKFNK
jgi:very-short-patch-repair endonuclease